MLLTERKIKILQAIIDDYIETAEPVGSRTIAKKHNLGVSSATIRNEMSDLEEMGYIIQPHTSSGRIPSDKGYRLYVDKLMQYKELNDEGMKLLEEIVINNINHIDYLMRESAKLLAHMTNYTTLASEPISSKTRFKEIKIIPLENKKIMLIGITLSDEVKNQLFLSDFELNNDEIEKLSNIVNKYLGKIVLEDLRQSDLEDLFIDLKGHEELIEPLFNLMEQAINSHKQGQIYLSGVNNILSFPEFSDLQKAKGVYEALEEKQELLNLFNQNNDTINIIIGDENENINLKNLSIISTSYKIAQHSIGNIAILGPTRMDYQLVISVLSGLMKNLEDVIAYLNSNDI